MKKMLLLLVVAAFVVGSALAVVAADAPATVKLDAKMGTVTLDHAKHTGLTDCKTCHHLGVEAGKCSSCHDAKPEAPKSKDAFHKLCKDCHKEKGPTKCKECHVK
jgi:hypothetical protein